MERLVEPRKYDIKDSNIELLDSDLERRVREHGGDEESAWEDAGTEPGVQIWRIEKFRVVPWPEERKGTFYDGDSYIVLNTYKKYPEGDALAYDLHFWLGRDTTQDEAGTAAYKTVELDDHLHGQPVQYREVQGSESKRFLSYFPRLIILQGGVSTGFHHVSEPPAPDVKRLYRITESTHQGPGGATEKSNIAIQEVPAEAQSLNKGDVFVLDVGETVYQYNSRDSSSKVRYLAARFVQGIADSRPGRCRPLVNGAFLSLLNAESIVSREPVYRPRTRTRADIRPPPPIIFRISDASGSIEFTRVSLSLSDPASDPPSRSVLSSDDAFLIDVPLEFPTWTSASTSPESPRSVCVYVWIGKNASLAENRLSLQIAQRYLYDKQKKHESESERETDTDTDTNSDTGERVDPAVPIIRVKEGLESDAFLKIFDKA